MLIGCLLLGFGWAAGEDDDLATARRQFERHNYKLALTAAERYLFEAVDDESITEVMAIRGQSLIKLRRFEEGVAVLEELLTNQSGAGEQAELHVALAQVGLRNYQYRYLSIKHFGRASKLYEAAGDLEAAAVAALHCGNAYVHFNAWKKLDDPDIEVPSDWRDLRALQRDLAVRSLDRALDLAQTETTAAAAMFRKASVYERDLRLDPTDVDQALELYRTLVSRWPTTAKSPLADLQVARILERHKQDYVAAVRQFELTRERYPNTHTSKRAAEAIERIVAPVVRTWTDGPILPGGPVEIQLEIRNVETLDFRAYRVDLFALARQVGSIRRLNRWEPEGAPVASWSLKTPDTGEHRIYSTRSATLEPTTAPIHEPGMYVIEAISQNASNRSVRTVTPVIVSRLAVVAKGGKDQSLLWAVDTLTGRPVSGADFLVQVHLGRNQYDYQRGRSNDAGFFRASEDERRTKRGGRSLTVYARDGEHVAVCNTWTHWYWWGYPSGYRLYAFTDRPVYRPAQVIHFKHVLRRYDMGDYETVAGKWLTLRVYGPEGEVVDERELRTNEHGSASGDLMLPSGAALGVYRMQVEIDGRYVHTGPGGQFRVEEYRKPEFEVTVSAAKERHRILEPVDVQIEARYYFGTPVADATVSYTIYRSPLRSVWHSPMPYPWYFTQLARMVSEHGALRPGPSWFPYRQEKSLVQRGEMRTDENGIALLRISPDADDSTDESDGFRYIVEAEVTDSSRRTVSGSGSVTVARFPFHINLEPQRRLYQPGDTVHIDVTARTPNDTPVAFKGTMHVHRLNRRETAEPAGAKTEVLEAGEVVAEVPIVADSSGAAVFRWVADEEGPFRFVVTAADAEGDVTGSCDVWIARRGGRFKHYAFRDVELVPDQALYEVGDTARVLITTRFDDAYVLFSVEADSLMHYQVVHVVDGSTLVEIPIETKHTPNVYLVATLLRDNKVHVDQRAIVIPPTSQFLDVTINAPAETFGPRAEAQFELVTTDADGQPVNAEVALMMVDAALYAIQPELRERVQEFFYGRARPHSVGTETSFDFQLGNTFGVLYGVRGEAGMSAREEVETKAYLADRPMSAKAGSAVPTNGGGAEFAAVEIRTEFPDSVLWTAHLNTGLDGRATFDVAFPDTLTTWRLIAVAIDDETRVGEASRDFVTRKEVIARLETPRFLVERDTCKITVIGHNEMTSAQEMKISLTTSGPVSIGQATRDGKPLEFMAPGAVVVAVEAGGQAAVDFALVANAPGSATFTATASTRLVGDGLEKQIPVLAFGSEKLLTETGVIRDTDESVVRTVAFTLPEEMNPDTPILEVFISPTIANVCLDAIPYLLEYPYGCTEQTMSRFLPAVITQRTLRRMGVKLSELASQAKITTPQPNARPRWAPQRHPVFNDGILSDIVAVGLGRLAELQNADGGWGWWREGASDPYMSAYVVYGLSEAKRAGVEFRSDLLSRGVAFLKRRVVSAAPAARYGRPSDDPNVRMWMLYALSTHDSLQPRGPGIAEVLDRVYENRDELTDYTRAMLAIVLHRIRDTERADIVIENLENTVRVDEETQTVSWGRPSGYYRWYHNGLEATAMVLRALMAVAPEHPHIPKAVNWLVRNRQGARWSSTKDTAFAVYALAEYLESSGELDADMTVTVTYDQKVSRSFRITPDNLLTFDARMIFAPEHLTPGDHTVTISKQGKGHVYYSTHVDYYTKEDPITAAGHEIAVKRTYYRLTPKEVERTRTIWDAHKRQYVEEPYRAIDYDRHELPPGSTVRSGDLIEVDLLIEARNDFEYLIFEDPKPAGCEPVELHSGAHFGGGIYTNMELRDRHVAFFANYLRQGEHHLTYRLRCETPGVFGALPTRVEAMYSPYVRANSDSARLTIGE